MFSANFRAEAREKLTGKWGKAALITLAYLFIAVVFSLLEDKTFGFANLIVSIVNLFIGVPLGFGLTFCFVKLFNDEDVKVFDFCTLGFDNFSKAWGISLRTVLKLLLPLIAYVVSIAILVSGLTIYASTLGGNGLTAILIGLILFVVTFIWFVTKSYYYNLTYMIAADNPEMTSKDIVEKSKELMKGNRFKLFCLEFSFIGWAFLSALTLGIGLFWLAPYMQMAHVSFYKYLTNKA